VKRVSIAFRQINSLVACVEPASSVPDEGSLRTFDAVGNDGEFILPRLVPSEHHVLAWDKLKKLMLSLNDAGKMGEALCGHALNLDGPPPYFGVPGLHGSLAQRFIHVTDNSHRLRMLGWSI
jgi:hypothetical protein